MSFTGELIMQLTTLVQLRLSKTIPTNRNTSKKPMLLSAMFVWILTNLSCSYEVSLNQHTVYTPPQLFTDYSLADENLKKCVRSSIQEGNITSANKLISLQCPGYNIQSLDGMHIFQQLRILNLSNNKIQYIEALSKLIHLTQVNLSDNQLSSITALAELPNLVFLDIKNNPLSNCEELKNKTIEKIHLPNTCLNNP